VHFLNPLTTHAELVRAFVRIDLVAFAARACVCPVLVRRIIASSLVAFIPWELYFFPRYFIHILYSLLQASRV
jgi:hypothetical protein